MLVAVVVIVFSVIVVILLVVVVDIGFEVVVNVVAVVEIVV